MALKKRKRAKRKDPVKRPDFRFDLLSRAVLEPLFSMIAKKPTQAYDVIIQLNEAFVGGRKGAREEVYELLGRKAPPSDTTHAYVFEHLTGTQVIRLLERDNDVEHRRARAVEVRRGERTEGLKSLKESAEDTRAIYKVSLDHKVKACLTKSLVTIKADAAHRAFNALGRGVVWAVLDTGIDRLHPHLRESLKVTLPVRHEDFTKKGGDPLEDEHGHGTHVAGIIAGRLPESEESTAHLVREVLINPREDEQHGTLRTEEVGAISGVAPSTTLVSFKVLDGEANGKVSDLLNAIDRIQQINDFGRRPLIHGVNMSLGYEFNARWFGAGQSPLCVEVDRLARSGVVVVVAAGNTGYGERLDSSGLAQPGFLPISINDPGNAEEAITVGSTHRDMPHAYGVSYFSSRGPTADGRVKPDLVAPGERIVSCLAGKTRRQLEARLEKDPKRRLLYAADSGTSMAAPHVSGAIAAFLSVHTEFIGRPGKVKEVFLASATDLKRERYFQGAGLVDLMRSLQAV